MENRLARLVLASFVLAAPCAADAAVICQKDNRVKLRPAACKPGWTQLAAFGGPGDPTGAWQFTDGALFQRYASRLEPRFLSLESDGSGRLNLAAGRGGALTCGRFTYARAATTLTMDLQSIGYLGTSVVRFAVDGSDRLAFEGADGRTAALVRVGAIPAESDCETLREVASFTGLPIPDYWTGLAFDGAQLWYNVQSPGEIVPVDPGTGTAGAQQRFGVFSRSYVHAAAGGAFWTHCACGGNETVSLMTADARVLEDVDTRALGTEIGVRAIAWDAGSSRLWLHGGTQDDGGKLLTVDASGAEPDDLLASADLDGDFTGLAFDGTDLWALQAQAKSLVRIDPATGVATGNYRLPPVHAEWRGVAAVGDELVVVGDTGTDGVLLKVARP